MTDWHWIGLECYCGDDRTTRARNAPVRIYSTWAEHIRSVVKLKPSAEIGNWRCGHCGRVQTFTAAHLRIATT